jgi:endogenous inhibitor of DNA gyrase (YacG/DUF329 family)
MDTSRATRKCPKCSATMQVGFLRDRERGRSRIAEWIQGIPEFGWLGNLKVRSRVRYRIAAFCCEGCGLLELYANGRELDSFWDY